MNPIIPDPGESPCRCRARRLSTCLFVDPTGCVGTPATRPACRPALVDRLTDRDERIVVRDRNRTTEIPARGVAVLLAAGRFADRVADRTPRLARLARRRPLRAARIATASTGPVATAAAASGLALACEGLRAVDAVLTPDSHRFDAESTARTRTVPDEMTTHLDRRSHWTRMFYEQRTSVPESPEVLRSAYEADLRAVVDRAGTETASAETDVAPETLDALLAGESPSLTLGEAAEVQSLADGEPEPTEIEALACEHLLLGMSTAVMDVEAVAAELAIDLDPKETQQKIERRSPMSFDEYVRLQFAIVDAMP